MRSLIRQCLSPDNLDKLIALARQLFYGRPILYGTLIYAFERLRREFDDQGIIINSRFIAMQQTFESPLLAAIDAEFDRDLPERLDNLHKLVFAF